MSWESGAEEIRARQVRAYGMGGQERIDRHHAGGKLTIRERIDKLVDPGSFMELGIAAGSYLGADDDTFVPDPYVCGLARIDGREVIVGGEDFTVRGGSEGSKKPQLVEQLASPATVGRGTTCAGWSSSSSTTASCSRSRRAGVDR